jgi:anti-sigma regulatory factor (Ser/Thr protein kinase)
MDIFETQLPSTKRAPQLARGWLRTTLQSWNLDGFGAVTELLATELVANAVDHVGEPMTVRIARDIDAIRVEVDDPSPTEPILQDAGSTDERGRGVFLIEAMANRWGAVSHPGDGKTVWFELDVSTGLHEAHGSS